MNRDGIIELLEKTDKYLIKNQNADWTDIIQYLVHNCKGDWDVYFALSNLLSSVRINAKFNKEDLQ